MAVGAVPELQPPLRTLTFDPKRPEEFFELYQSSPFCQEAQFELLRALIVLEKLGQGPALDFVFVSLGSMALLGYETGSDSSLMGQMALQLDAQIQLTLEMLNKAPWKNNYNLIFAAAHGAPPEPDPALRSQKAISGESLARTIGKTLSTWIDNGAVKNAYVDKYVRIARCAQTGGRDRPAPARRGGLLHSRWRLLAHRRVAPEVRKQFSRITFRRRDAFLRAGSRGRFWRGPRRIVRLAV
jgi:hypothetical protein